MRYLKRRGFTLIEIMVALAIFGLVAAAFLQVILTGQRVTAMEQARAGLQSNLRVGSMMVPNELRMLNQSDTSDILAISDTSVMYLAMRGYYTLCAAPTSTTTINVMRVPGTGLNFDYRPAAALDNAFIFYEDDTLKMSDDKWVRVGISAVAAGTCTYPSVSGSSRASLALTLSPGIPTTWASNNPILNRFLEGSPVRTYEVTRMSLYSDNGQNWFGMCTGGSVASPCTLQPVLGPLAPTNGVTITQYDSAGTAVHASTLAQLNSLRSMQIRFIGISDQKVAHGTGNANLDYVTDTLTTVVTLRNVRQN
jgi:prepilin-type N-terminal cleavage/methylation domain-containing protein